MAESTPGEMQVTEPPTSQPPNIAATQANVARVSRVCVSDEQSTLG
jgi:hypothetical protein